MFFSCLISKCFRPLRLRCVDNCSSELTIKAERTIADQYRITIRLSNTSHSKPDRMMRHVTTKDFTNLKLALPELDRELSHVRVNSAATGNHELWHTIQSGLTVQSRTDLSIYQQLYSRRKCWLIPWCPIMGAVLHSSALLMQ